MPTRGLSEPSEFFGRVAQISDQELVARAKTLFDCFTNYQIAVVTLRGMSAYHFFPKSFLKARNVSSARANVCANLIMLTSVSNIRRCCLTPA